MFGFSLLFNNSCGSSDSVTSLSGQVQIIDGKEKIVTSWLLTTQTDEDDDWHSTLIGKDVFTREPKPEDKIIKSISKGVKHSFPKDIPKKNKI